MECRSAEVSRNMAQEGDFRSGGYGATTLKIASIMQNGTVEDIKGVETIFAGRPFSRSDIIVVYTMRDPAGRDFWFVFFWTSKRKWTTTIEHLLCRYRL